MLIQLRGWATDSPRVWSPPGGKVEDGETWWEGALREFEEEMGCSCPGVATARWDYNAPGLVFRTHVVPIAHADSVLPAPRPSEVAAWGWFGRELLQGLPLHPGFASFLAAVDPFTQEK